MPNYTFRLPGSKGVNVSDTPADTEVLTFDAASDQYVSSAGGSGGHTIQEEGAPLTARTNLNFIGAGVTATDNAGTNATDVTITTGTPPFADTNSIVEGGTDATKELRIEVDGITALTTRVWTAPDADLIVVGTTTTQTLQNKSVDADANTITNIENADIKAAAAIAYSKLALTNSIVEGDIVNNAISLGKMATGTAGNLITYSAAGAPAVVATGTATHVLTSNGAGAAPTFQAVGGGTGAFTDYIPCVMEVPNDTVAYPDVFTLGDASSKITGMWLPNSAASTIDFKVIVPEDLHATPAAKVVIYMLPRTTVAASTVNLTLSRIYVDNTEDVDAALTAETAVDVELTSTADFLTIYSYDVTAEPTAGELFHGTLKRDPAAANDDFTEDLFIVGIVLKIERATA